jgi:hypothetical protein
MKTYQSLCEEYGVETLYNANLKGLNLEGADLRGGTLRFADLRQTMLDNANLEGVNLRCANLEGALLYDTNLSNANLQGANLRGTHLKRTNVYNANFSYTSLETTTLNYCTGLQTMNITFITCGNNTNIFTLQAHPYLVVYNRYNMAIGCEQHSIKEWFKFKDETINKMDEGALQWWKTWKPILKGIIKENNKIIH